MTEPPPPPPASPFDEVFRRIVDEELPKVMEQALQQAIQPLAEKIGDVSARLEAAERGLDQLAHDTPSATQVERLAQLVDHLARTAGVPMPTAPNAPAAPPAPQLPEDWFAVVWNGSAHVRAVKPEHRADYEAALAAAKP